MLKGIGFRAAVLGLLFCLSGWSDDLLCFGQFREKIEKPLLKPPPLKPGSIQSHEGKRGSDGAEYAGARAVVRKPLKDLYLWLLDHTNWKDMSKTRLKTVESKKPGYLAFHTVEVDVNVWAFIRIQWVEEWAYALVEGTLKEPKEIQVSYQKKSGTSHLTKLCGSVTLKAMGPRETDVYFYEEAIAERYHWQQMLEMHTNNFKRLDLLGGENK